MVIFEFFNRCSGFVEGDEDESLSATRLCELGEVVGLAPSVITTAGRNESPYGSAGASDGLKYPGIGAGCG